MYQSILYSKSTSDEIETNHLMKEFHKDMEKDLNLDRMFYELAIGNHREAVMKVLQTPLTSRQEIEYRQQIFQDLEQKELFCGIESFCKSMDQVDHQINSSKRLVYDEQRSSLYLNIVNQYCNGVDEFYRVMNSYPIKSQGLQAFLTCLNRYVESDTYQMLRSESRELVAEAAKIRYHLTFEEYAVVISKSTATEGYSQELLDLFHEFLPTSNRKGHCKRFEADINMNEIELRILQSVKKMFPEIFVQILNFEKENQTFQEKEIECFREEIQFYLNYLNYIAPIQRKGYDFCYPEVSDHSTENEIQQGFDLLLAQKLVKEEKQVVANDFQCKEGERVFLVTGPNQGGKTTFSRMVGQILYLSTLGVPVAAKKVNVVLCQGVFTHFEHEEVAYNDRGKLQEELIRMHDIFDLMPENSLVIINEMLSSTSYWDAVVIGEKMIQKLMERQCISIFVTFVDELAQIKDENKVISLTSQIDEDGCNRTFRIRRGEADGQVYAKSLADQYELSYDKLRERLKMNTNDGEGETR